MVRDVSFVGNIEKAVCFFVKSITSSLEYVKNVGEKRRK